MEIYIDNLKAELDLTGITTLDAIIKEAERISAENGKIVSEVLIDGAPLDEVEEVILDNIGVMEIVTKTPKVVFLEALQEMNGYLDRLRDGLKKVVDYLEQDNEREAMNVIAAAVNGLEWIYNIFSAGENISSINYVELGFEETFNKYKNILNELLQSIENRDSIMLADLFNYEVIPLIDEIQDSIPRIYSHILEEEERQQKN